MTGILLIFYQSLALSTAIDYPPNRPPSTYQAYLISDHSPILIESNEDFISQGWPGNGSETNPYTIANLRIQSDELTCIDISNVSVYYSIIDCELLTTSRYYVQHGIHLEEASYAKIESCVITNVEFGIMVLHSDGCVILDTYVGDCSLSGVSIWQSDDCTIKNCDIKDNGWIGVDLYWTEDCSVINCNLEENHWAGVRLEQDHDCRILNNIITCEGESGSIDLIYSDGSIIRNNTLLSGGIVVNAFVAQHRPPTIENNTINGNSVGFFNDTGNFAISPNDFGQILLYRCSNLDIIDGQITGATVGIQVILSQSCTIENVLLKYNARSGLRFHSSANCMVSNSTFEFNGAGIRLYRSENTIIRESTIRDNHWSGVDMFALENCIIMRNSIFRNHLFGLVIDNCVNCTIDDNDVVSNGLSGFLIVSSQSLLVKRNLVQQNGHIGIEFTSDSSNNFVYDNRLAENEGGNANDNGHVNQWDDGISIGNFWDDYNQDGNYAIPGSASSMDHFPLTFDAIRNTAPSLDSPPDITFQLGATDIQLTWNPSAISPSHYEIFKNDSLVEVDEWNGSQITIDITSLDAGVYSYRIVVYERGGLSATDTILVTVLRTDTPTGDETLPGSIDYSPLVQPLLWGSLLVIEIIAAVIIISRRT
jgi:parallel beta-helix repeat protein